MVSVMYIDFLPVSQVQLFWGGGRSRMVSVMYIDFLPAQQVPVVSVEVAVEEWRCSTAVKSSLASTSLGVVNPPQLWEVLAQCMWNTQARPRNSTSTTEREHPEL